MAESLMTKEERAEVEERKRMWAKVEKHMGLMVGVGVKVAGGEEVVRIGQSELRRLEAVQEERKRKWTERHAGEMRMVGNQGGSGAGVTAGQPGPPGTPGQPGVEPISFEVNVVGVRLVQEKHRVRHKSHEVGCQANSYWLCANRQEFLIRTQRGGLEDVFVSRRYGDFKRLAEEVRTSVDCSN